VGDTAQRENMLCQRHQRYGTNIVRVQSKNCTYILQLGIGIAAYAADIGILYFSPVPEHYGTRMGPLTPVLD
jgi:hypothetical protein